MLTSNPVDQSPSADRTPTAEEFCHERLGSRFAAALSDYDTTRRVEVLVDDFLTDAALVGKRVLDVGCGLGFFSKRLAERGAQVTACDLGPSLVRRTRDFVGCESVVADAMQLVRHFGEQSFDGVVSSECIEHVPQPAEALRQMIRVVKPGGFLSISTPNVLWRPIVQTATMLRLRPFDGHENFSSWQSLRRVFQSSGAVVRREVGVHLFPFQIPLHSLSRLCDRHLQCLRPLMINICMLAQKPHLGETPRA